MLLDGGMGLAFLPPARNSRPGVSSAAQEGPSAGRSVLQILAALTFGLLCGLILAACGSASPAGGTGPDDRDAHLPEMTAAKLAGTEKLRVVATTALLADIVGNVAGDAVELTTLIGPGVDPHTYQPTPQDIAAIERAHVVFINGLGLEEGLESTVDAAASQGQPVVSVSAGIRSRVPSDERPAGESASDTTHAQGVGDPHVWFDPANVKTWVSNIQQTLATLDPAHAQAYRANAEAYARKLDDLDAYIRAEVGKIPADRRKLVTDHDSFGYFADRYGFQIIGTVAPGISTAAEPSSADLAVLIDAIRKEEVPAVFTGTTSTQKLSDLVAAETGTRVLPLYTGEMGPAGSGADTYLGMMRTDVDTIVAGLSQP